MKKLIVLAATLLVACGSGDKKAQLDKLRAEYATLGEKVRVLEEEIGAEGAHKEEIKTVRIDTVKKQDFARRVMVQGVVDGDEILTLNPRASGEITMLKAEVGQSVRAGQIIAKIDDAILRKGLDELETAYDLAKTVYERQAALWKDSIGSEIQYIQARNNKQSIERKIASLNEQIALYVVKAPINGTIEQVNTKLGQMVSPGVPVVMMINLNKLKVVAEASESYSNSVKKGDKINVNFPDINKNYELLISSVSNVISPKNRTFVIEAKLPNGITDVKANMMAKVAVENYRVKDVVVVPVNVVFKDNQGEYLFVVVHKDGKTIAEKRTVQTGVVSENQVEIISGLAQGDVIVTMGYQSLEDASEVQVVNQ